MSKGNINYKYLRRRKNWFVRNLPLVIISVAAIILLAVGIVVGVLFGTGKIGKGTNSSASNQNSANEDNGAVEDQTREIVWIDNKEPEQEKAVVYTPPANVTYPYFIKVNRAMNCVTVYGIDDQGKYTIPVKAFACSCGRAGHETILGESMATLNRSEWRLMVDGTFGHFAVDISGDYLFHSVPYTAATHNSLETEEFNKLGDYASLGCVRMSVGDVKWIYDNCKVGTKVTIYDDATTPGPLGKPETIKIPVDSPNARWDPTDPDPANPWLLASAEVKGASDITTRIGEKVDIMKGITAVDTCGNDITSKIITIGRYTFDQEGTYNITYKVTDAIGSTKEVTVKLNVTK